MLFCFAALSIARAATCSDFQISANGTSINAPPGNSTVPYSIMIGEDLEFTVSPVGDILSWTRLGVTITEVPSYSPPISVIATGNKAQTMVLIVKNCGKEKTINLNLLVRPYTVTFDPNGGSPTPQTQKVEPGNFAIAPTAPTKAGYNFSRWEMPVGTAYSFSTTPVTDSITLKAAWTPKNYTITFDPQSGVVSPTSKSVTYNMPVGTPLPTPTKTGYDFSGWYSAASGGIKYMETTVYQTADNVTLYARWTAKKYTIIFNVNSPDGNVSPHDQFATYDAPVGTLPTPTRVAHEFKGWYSAASGGTIYEKTTIYRTDGPTTLYARWEFIKGTRPKAEMLNFTIPSGLVYSGAQITPLPTPSKKAIIYGEFGAITVLYNGQPTPLPKDAGTYAISAFIDKNTSGDYDTATVSLGSMTIARAPATLYINSATVKSKTYDAKTTAEIVGNVNFSINPLYAGDTYSSSDYSVRADFVSPDVGNGIPVNITISWLPNGPMSKNYIISTSPLSYATTADITQATGELRIIDPLFDKEPPFYEYTRAENYGSPIVEKSPFIPDGVKVTFEYKKDGEDDGAYTALPPNRLGLWYIKATLTGTANYTGATDFKVFEVIRGNAKRVKHEVEFSSGSFTKDSDLSDTLRRYYVANLCEIKNTTIKITILAEPDIVLKLKNDSPHKDSDHNGFVYYDIPFEFKPGLLHTLFYTLRSAGDIYVYEEEDTLLIETPIPFDEKIAKQKWNNVIFINNNPKDNGGYEFTDFRWFKNKNKSPTADSAVSDLQFYSAGPKSTDILNPSDIYKATMHTKDGVRVSTCEGSPKIITLPAAGKSTAEKQVLGINGKTAKPEQKVYDIYGAQRKDTPAGVYIIKDK
jgi:uncharacterized repeat protein (TIGR02543 family)